MIRARVLGTGSALPSRVLGNAELAGRLGSSEPWIESRTGIRERRVCTPADGGEAPADAACALATAAGAAALSRAGLAPADVDAIIVATVTSDAPTPACAVQVQHALGCPPCAAFDVSAACAGFVYALHVADALVRAGAHRRVLVIGVEVMSRIVDWQDKNTAVLFGDGAGAVVLGAEPASDAPDAPGVLASRLHADGAGAALLGQVRGGRVHMQGPALFAQAVKLVAAVCDEVLAAAGVAKAELAHVVAHQANVRLIDAVAQRVGLARERFRVNIDRVGNTSAASIPIALDEAARAGAIAAGQLVLLVGLGAGLAWGAQVLRW